MTLDEAIKHAEEVAEEQRELFSLCPIPSDMCDPNKDCASLKNGKNKGCIKCAKEHEQLAKWLKELKQLKEQEPCEDAISRQVVKEQMIKYGFHAPDMTVTEFVEDLPPVTPQPKMGHWISHYDEDAKEGWWHECDRCHAERAFNTKFCPDCGAKMITPQESEDKE